MTNYLRKIGSWTWIIFCSTCHVSSNINYILT